MQLYDDKIRALETRIEILENHHDSNIRILEKINEQIEIISKLINGWINFGRGVAVLSVLCMSLISALFWSVVHDYEKTNIAEDAAIAQLQSDHIREIIDINTRIKSLELIVNAKNLDH